MAEIQTPSGDPQDSRSQFDLTLFAEGLQRNPDGVWHRRGMEPIRNGSLLAIGFFNVLEPIDDQQAFLREICRYRAPGGRIYDTVPTGRWLWSDDDVQAGHFRRYTRSGLRPLLVNKMFLSLALLLFLCRLLRSRLGRRRLPARSYSGLHRPRGRTLMSRVWQWAQVRLARGQSITCGTSCLAVAELSSSAHA